MLYLQCGDTIIWYLHPSGMKYNLIYVVLEEAVRKLVKAGEFNVVEGICKFQSRKTMAIMCEILNVYVMYITGLTGVW